MKKSKLFLRSGLASRICFVSLVLVVLGSGCDMFAMPDKMDDMNKKMDQTNQQITQTNSTASATQESVRKQELATDLQNIFAPVNTEYTFPIPADMMPFGKDFAGAMHEDEFAQLVYLYVKDIDEVGPDPSLQNADGSWPAAVATAADQDKMLKFYAIEIIAGFADQDMIQQTIDTEQTQGGEYGGSTVYTLLAARANFIYSVLWDNTLNTANLDTPGKIQTAIGYAQNLDYIDGLSFASQIQYTSIGMLAPSPQITVTRNAPLNWATTIWKKAYASFTDKNTGLLPQYVSALDNPSDPTGDSLRAMKAQIQTRLQVTN